MKVRWQIANGLLTVEFHLAVAAHQNDDVSPEIDHVRGQIGDTVKLGLCGRHWLHPDRKKVRRPRGSAASGHGRVAYMVRSRAASAKKRPVALGAASPWALSIPAAKAQPRPDVSRSRILGLRHTDIRGQLFGPYQPRSVRGVARARQRRTHQTHTHPNQYRGCPSCAPRCIRQGGNTGPFEISIPRIQFNLPLPPPFCILRSRDRIEKLRFIAWGHFCLPFLIADLDKLRVCLRLLSWVGIVAEIIKVSCD